jgi:hypothetical protein
VHLLPAARLRATGDQREDGRHQAKEDEQTNGRAQTSRGTRH